jgi:Domain of unknown function (DUF4602)
MSSSSAHSAEPTMSQSGKKRPLPHMTTAATKMMKTTRKHVELVTCGVAFPISKRPYSPPNAHSGVIAEIPEPASASLSRIKNRVDSKKNVGLDWNETVREVKKFGAMGWGGQQPKGFTDDSMNDPLENIKSSLSDRKKYRLHKEEEYLRLTGRTMKHHAVPLPIVRGLKKKAQEREQRQLQEARDAGVVLPKSATSLSSRKKQEEKKQMNFTRNRVYGPAPSIGFVKRGVFRVRGEK